MLPQLDPPPDAFPYGYTLVSSKKYDQMLTRLPVQLGIPQLL